MKVLSGIIEKLSIMDCLKEEENMGMESKLISKEEIGFGKESFCMETKLDTSNIILNSSNIEA